MESSLSEAILPISPTSQRRIGMYFEVECDVHGNSFFYADIMDNTVYRFVKQAFCLLINLYSYLFCLYYFLNSLLLE